MRTALPTPVDLSSQAEYVAFSFRILAIDLRSICWSEQFDLALSLVSAHKRHRPPVHERPTLEQLRTKGCERGLMQ